MKNSPLALLRAMRPHQWTKNAFVFAALIFALGDRQQSIGSDALLNVVFAALAFCLVSSGIYLMNDLKDVEQDRLHPIKCKRPIAAGLVTPVAAISLSILLLSAGLALAHTCNFNVFKVILTYVGMQVAYTFILKQIALVDVFIIAFGFVLRAMAGALAVPVHISPWLLLCTLLLALFLALCKRRHEKVTESPTASETRSVLEKYDGRLLDQLVAIVCAATIVCYALYTLWPDTVEKFGSHNLAFTIPFVLFGLFRYLDLVYRHDQGGRPDKILLTDVPLMVDLALYGVTVLWVLKG